MKKFRGKKRYFRNMWHQANAECYDLDFGNESWFDLWHTHLDFYGHGNNDLKIRREHCKAHIALYLDLLEKLQTLDQPYQSWFEIVSEDAVLDAIYIHTPNPNADNFPLKIDNINWNCAVPHYLIDVIDLDKFTIGQYQWNATNNYIVQSKNNGVKL